MTEQIENDSSLSGDATEGQLQSPEYLQRAFSDWKDLDLFITSVLVCNSIPFNIQSHVNNAGQVEYYVVAYENLNRM